MKFKSLVSYLFVGLLSLSVLTGCGGGDTTATPENNTSQEDNGGTLANNGVQEEVEESVNVTKGYLIAPPIQGVTYLCDGNVGLSNDNGMFECVNAPIIFKIGNLTLGTLTAFTADGKVYPQDLLGLERNNYSNSRLKLLARLLQSLDDDGNVNISITITQSVRDGLTKEQKFKDLTDDDVSTLVSGVGKSFVNECGAMNHLGDKSVNCNGDGSYVVTPTFTSSSTVTVPENQTEALTLQVTETSTPITYSISGGDSSSFSVNSSTGVVTFNTAPDYETKNSYTFTATATDTKGNSATQSVTINISDVVEVTPRPTPQPSSKISKIKKTGQTTSYADFDDGYYQKGVTQSYTRDDDKEVVIDNITGLMWLDDESVASVTKPWVTQENYYARNYNDTTGDTATTYCAELVMGGFEDWRLPTIRELKDIADYGRILPAINSAFLNNRTYAYWSSTVRPDRNDLQFGFDFSRGIKYNLSKGNRGGYVQCVRLSSSPLNADFTRDNVTDIVTDNVTGLMWQDDDIGSQATRQDVRKSQISWQDAINRCEALSLGGFEDWRLPNLNELMSLIDDNKISPSINAVFQNTGSDSYWSSTTYANKEDHAWLLSLSSGFHTEYSKRLYGFVRCVRAGE